MLLFLPSLFSFYCGLTSQHMACNFLTLLRHPDNRNQLGQRGAWAFCSSVTFWWALSAPRTENGPQRFFLTCVWCQHSRNGNRRIRTSGSSSVTQVQGEPGLHKTLSQKHTHKYIHTYIHTYIYTYMYIHIYAHMRYICIAPKGTKDKRPLNKNNGKHYKSRDAAQ